MCPLQRAEDGPSQPPGGERQMRSFSGAVPEPLICMREHKNGCRVGRHVFEQSVLVRGESGKGFGCNGFAWTQAGDGCHALRAVSAGLAEGLAERFSAGEQQNKVSALGDGWLVLGRSLDQPALGSIRLNQYRANLRKFTQISHPCWREAAQLAFGGWGRCQGDMLMRLQGGMSFCQEQRLVWLNDQGVCLVWRGREDVGSRRGDDALALRRQLCCQAIHRGGFAARAHERNDDARLEREKFAEHTTSAFLLLALKLCFNISDMLVIVFIGAACHHCCERFCYLIFRNRHHLVEHALKYPLGIQSDLGPGAGMNRLKDDGVGLVIV